MQPISIDLLLHCKWVLPIVPNNQILQDHSIAIDGGRILETLTTADAKQKYIGLETETLEKHLVMPGLINTHCHSSSRLLRGIENDSHAKHWLDTKNPASNSLFADAKFLTDSTKIAIAEMIKTGTTCFAEINSPGEIQAEIARNTAIRSQLGFALQEVPSAFGNNAEDYLHRGLKLRDNHANNPLLKIACSLTNISQIDDATLGQLAAFANELDLPIQIQCNETKKAIEDSLKKSGHRPLQRLNQQGLLLPETQLVEISQLNCEDLSLLEMTKNHLVIYPQQQSRLTDEISPSLLAKTVSNMSIGSANASENTHLNLLHAIQAAALSAQAGDHYQSPHDAAHQALRMATINGAKTLGWDNDIGSIEQGKYADLIAIEIDSIHHQPLYNPVSQLVFSSVDCPVTHSWVYGQPLLRAKKLCTLDENKLIQSARDWGKKLANEFAQPH